MSFVNKKGKTTSTRLMTIRQQVSDVFCYGRIVTTVTKAKETQRHVDRVITLAKKGTLDAIRRINAKILPTKNFDTQALTKKILEIGKQYEKRNGGYTRVLKLGTRRGDRTEEAILELV
ncbi:MAG: 50S ribosomal protein L17 [Mycoplasmataceae bacterium]|jgi:large subunit ribosomal protein L17|nr:50S ribosomal protein L17 [Mycoplasmataceae bacterium]